MPSADNQASKADWVKTRITVSTIKKIVGAVEISDANNALRAALDDRFGAGNREADIRHNEYVIMAPTVFEIDLDPQNPDKLKFT